MLRKEYRVLRNALICALALVVTGCTAVVVGGAVTGAAVAHDRRTTGTFVEDQEIFLRELISNASDALDRLRFAAIADDSVYEGDGDLRIELEVDEEKGLLTVRDNGIGMNRDDVMENIGTIARSGTRAKLAATNLPRCCSRNGASPTCISSAMPATGGTCIAGTASR